MADWRERWQASPNDHTRKPSVSNMLNAIHTCLGVKPHLAWF
jgi:hypothetical protein